MSEENIVEVGGQTFDLYKKGGEQARQVTKILKWLGKYATPIIAEFSNDEGRIVFDDTFQFLSSVAQVLDDVALMDAFQIVLGCDSAFAEENFDILVLADSVQALFNNETYKNAISRFFGGSSSQPDSE